MVPKSQGGADVLVETVSQPFEVVHNKKKLLGADRAK